MKEEKIIEKIKKCLALAENNPSEEEAKAAALQAQKLLAKYNISMVEVQELGGAEKITEHVVWFTECGRGATRSWKYELASIVANNFRCKYLVYGREAVGFYGHQADTIAAAEVFKYLFSVGDRLADRAVHKTFRRTHKEGQKANVAGVYNSWVAGFMQGLKESFAKQSTALMIVTPQDVVDAFEEEVKNCKRVDLSMKIATFNSEAYKEGHAVGKSAMGQRSLEA